MPTSTCVTMTCSRYAVMELMPPPTGISRMLNRFQIVAPTVRPGGVNQALIMPNLQNNLVTSVKRALDYSSRIKAALGKDEVDLLMTLYLHQDVTPDTIREAKKAGVAAVKRCVLLGALGILATC
ncbi:hypothetical protein CaCOL14_005651 [Colletotrichum acutatum]